MKSSVFGLVPEDVPIRCRSKLHEKKQNLYRFLPQKPRFDHLQGHDHIFIMIIQKKRINIGKEPKQS